MTDDEITDLRALGMSMRSAVAGADMALYSALNAALHARDPAAAEAAVRAHLGSVLDALATR